MLPLKNKCFALLPNYIREILQPHLKLREIRKGVPIASLVKEPTLFFPINCVLTITATSTDQRGSFLRFASSGVAIGLHPGDSCEVVRSEAVVCGTGHLLTISSAIVWGLLSSPSVLSLSRSKLTDAIASRALICSFCASRHSIAQRLATILLSAEDEFGRGSEISVTQSEISDLLFVRRESIAHLLADWARCGTILTGRSKIIIQDRGYLLAQSCECYQNSAFQVSREFDAWASLSWLDNEAAINAGARYSVARRGSSFASA